MPATAGALLAVILATTAGGSPALVLAADPVLVGAGDIADCSTASDSSTAALLDDIGGTVFTLGDNAYPSGTAANFRDCYTPTWGRHLARTRPAAGNHDYATQGAKGYFDYFGAAAGEPGKGYYSYDLGTWHIVVLNSNCGPAGGCEVTSPQVVWLKADLAASDGKDVLAYWHKPLFSSGFHGASAKVHVLWQVLYDAGADVVLNGHDHDYERFAPQDPEGRLDADYGLREFVVGTGGTELRPRSTHAANSQVFSTTHGLLRLTLHPGNYDWSFEPIAGSTFTDSGSAATHGPPPQRTTFAVSGDAHVDQARPTANFGGSRKLRVDGDTGHGLDREAYLKVRVKGLTGIVDRAVLRVWVRNGTTDGPRAYPTTTDWRAKTIRWRNRPAATSPWVSDSGTIPGGAWFDIDVTAIVDGNGTFGLLLRPTSGNGLAIDSNQGAHPPRLIVETIPN